MIRVSSDWTLFYKLFFPTVWTVFFGIIIFVLLVYLHMPVAFKLAFVLSYVVGLAVLYFTLFRLKRVECTDTHLYVTNYFRTYKYTFDSVEQIHSTDFILFRVVSIKFKARTAFGRKIYFLRRRVVWDEQLAKHEELASRVD